MGPGLISFLVALSGGAWIYTKLMRSSGNNVKQSVIAVTVAGAMIFLVLFSILSLIFK